MNEDSLSKFQDLLRTLFQFDSADLDFGIYRILNHKRHEVERFITERLPKIVDGAFKQYAAEEKAAIEKELEQTREEIKKNLGEGAFEDNGQLKEGFRETPLGKKYSSLREQLNRYQIAEELKTHIYNDLYAFFSRYYEDGDFISKRRYGRQGTYAIPYNGEEVVLYWANRDQYYVKTEDRFKAYRFKANGYTVSFELRNVALEQKGNNGKKRYFVLAQDNPVTWHEPEKTLSVAFEYRPLTEDEEKAHGRTEQQKPQDSLNVEAERRILEKVEDNNLQKALKAPEGTNGRSLLLKHLTRFTRKNTSDFFIHKDLKGFLSRELDFFIKNEVLLLDELIGGKAEDLQQHILRARVVRQVATGIIDFLAQIENFQKKLWEKRKFVLRTDYCVTIGKLPEELWDEVLANEKQREEWRELYSVNEEVDKDFLKTHPTLVVDTSHFSEDFKWRLLSHFSHFEDLDEVIDGLLVKSENWQALNLLQEKYRERVKCIYIDPPYNTGSDEFLYRDNYQHSSWLTMVQNRLSEAYRLIANNGAIFINNDENEYSRLRILLDTVFGSQFIENLIWRKKSGGGQTDEYFVTEHDYITCYAKQKGVFALREKTLAKSSEGYPLYDEKKRKRYKRVKLAKWGAGAHKEDRPTMYFPLVAPDGQEVYPVAPDGKPGRWRYGRAKISEMLENDDIDWVEKDGTWTVYEKDYEPEEGELAILKERSILYDLVENASGSNELKALFGVKDVFLNPKPSDLIYHLLMLSTDTSDVILDFFAGSGTTGHAVINLNREDGGRRKFILVEMAHYFDTVLLPRIKKVIFTPEWRDGKPKRMATAEEAKRSPRIIKVIRLESYEDTLNNLEFPREKEGQLAFEKLGDEYLLKYMLEFETRGSPSLLNLEMFKDPFSYKLKVQEGEEIVERPVDLVETFNYLLGIQVRRMLACEHNGRPYRAVLGEKDGKKVAIVWRSVVGLENNEEELQKDRDFIEEKVLPALLGDGKPDRLLVNGPSFLENAEAIEPEFHRLMFAPVGV